MSSLSASESIILSSDVRLPPHCSHASSSASGKFFSRCFAHHGSETVDAEDILHDEVAPLVQSDRTSLLLDALDNESLIFEDEEREFLEGPIVSTFPTPIVPPPPEHHGLVYECTSNASFYSIDEDPSAFLDTPPPPHSYEVDFTPDARGVIVPSHALFPDFLGVMIHAPMEGEADQPMRTFVDEDNCFIRELPDPELLASPATTFSGEVLSGDDYIVVTEGFTVESSRDIEGEPGGEMGEGENMARYRYHEQNRDVREPCPLPRSIADKKNACTASQTSLRALYDPEPGLSETLSSLIRSTSASSEWARQQDAQDTRPPSAPEAQGIVLVPSKTINAEDTCMHPVSDSTDAEICYTGVVPSLVLYVAESEDWDAQDHCLPPFTSYDYELLYAPPLGNNGRMEDDWAAYHYPVQALMEGAEPHESCVQDICIWNELTERVAAWRASGMGGSEPVTDEWKVGRREQPEGKEAAAWQDKNLTSWFSRKFETGKRRLKKF